MRGTVVHALLLCCGIISAQQWKNVGNCGAGLKCGPQCQRLCLIQHNYYRSLHNSPPLKCDPKLAESAQSWADSNARQKSVHRSVPTRDYVENISWKRWGWKGMGNKLGAIPAAVRSWYSELKRGYDYNTGKSKGVVTHFKSVVHPREARLGCGINIKPGDGTYVVAHYSLGAGEKFKLNDFTPLRGVGIRKQPGPQCHLKSFERQQCGNLISPIITPEKCINAGCCYDDMFMDEPGLQWHHQKASIWCFKRKSGIATVPGVSNHAQAPARWANGKILARPQSSLLKVNRGPKLQSMVSPGKPPCPAGKEELTKIIAVIKTVTKVDCGQGATTAPPMSTAVPPGSTTLSPVSTTASPGSPTTPPGSTTAPSGSTTASSGSTTVRTGPTIAPPGSTTAPSGSTTAPSGSTTAPSGPTTAPGSTTAPSGPTSPGPPGQPGGRPGGQPPLPGPPSTAAPLGSTTGSLGSTAAPTASTVVPTSGVAAAQLGAVEKQGMNMTEFQKDCLKSHNEYRAKHGVPPLKWSAQLAADARKWADRLAAINKVEHDMKSIENGVGENIHSFKPNHTSNGTTTTIKMPTQCQGPKTPTCVQCREIVKEWYAEEPNFDYNTGEPKGEGGVVIRFTQVVWKETTELGMATATSDDTWFTVARYKPRGSKGFPEGYKKNVPRPQ